MQVRYDERLTAPPELMQDEQSEARSLTVSQGEMVNSYIGKTLTKSYGCFLTCVSIIRETLQRYPS